MISDGCSSTVRGRGGRRVLAPLASAALAAALLAGCGGAATDDPAESPGTETTEPTDDDATTDGDTEDDTTDDATDDASDGTTEEPTDGDGTDDGETDGGEADDDAPTGENLFEGSWGFGHDTKVLSAEELADLLEEEAESRGPEEMSLDVECADGVDTGAGDDTAECIAYADEGVEHPWSITVGPADSGLEIEVENVG